MTDYLVGQLLIAMPNMDDPRFHNSVVLICIHDDASAMGLMINRHAGSLTLNDLAAQIGIGMPAFFGNEPVFDGGPVDQARGMVLHSNDHLQPESISIGNNLAITSNIKILTEIANGCGPDKFLIALGHASWSPGQLERELMQNVWLTVPCDAELIFADDHRNVWSESFTRLGITAGQMATVSGHA